MDGLSDRVIQEAFTKTLSENTVTPGKLCLIKKEDYEKVLTFLRIDMIPTEPICEALDVKWNPELEAMFVSALDHNISLMLLDETNGDVMGVRVTGIAKVDEGTDAEFKSADRGMEKMVAFWKYGDEKTKFFDRYNTREAISYFGLAVGIKYRRKGIAKLLVDFSVRFLRNLNIYPMYIKCAGASLYSQKVFEGLGFDLLEEIKYNEYVQDGQNVIKRSDAHTSLRTYGKVVRPLEN